MSNKCGQDGQAKEPMQKRDTAIRKAGDRGDGAKNHQEPLLGAGRAEDFAQILLLNCWCNYASFAEGESRLREVKLLATDPSESTFLYLGTT